MKIVTNSTLRCSVVTTSALVVAVVISIPRVDASLVGLWQFNKASGPAIDSTGNGNTGTFVGGATRAPSKAGFGNAGSFFNDGFTNNYVEVGPDPSLVIGSAGGASWSTAAWVLEDPNVGAPGSHVSSYGTFLHYRRQIDDVFPYPSPDYGLSFQTGATGDSQLYVWHGTNGAWQHGTSIAPTIDDWVHYAYTYDGNTLRVYVNGSEQYTSNIGVQDPTYVLYDGALQIGGAPGFLASRNWNGLVDDVAIFDELLSPGDIATIMTGDFTAYGVPEPSCAILLLASTCCLVLRRRFLG